MALFVRRFNKFIRKKKSQPKRAQSLRKKSFNERKFFVCGAQGYIAMYCPNIRKIDKSVEDKKKKKFLKKNKDGQAYHVEWDFDASSNSGDEGEAYKLNVDIAINKAPSFFSTPRQEVAKR
jgi:hypothetical protein